ncbi:MAG TPA: biotin transporter BioY [Candidatus Syntrophoarchaeum butanivorans]|uniref:BioY protein n=1 Tax=Candidatus Syntropharchaeum butanivorans TaxID=1839936 RepID=A0A1F2P8L6_9EURY|nr:MAG: BioY protein [Candidatus Syntrophoarchaeum butanivorans]HEC57513.1 biotin transporter BioY [Candidatus Syntrophoarchaeum butanivorans]
MVRFNSSAVRRRTVNEMEICGSKAVGEYLNINRIVLAFLFAGLTGIAAQIRIPLPFTPVPITGQVLFVLLSGVMIGRYGGLSQLIYVGAGAAGVPWFSNFSGGASVLGGVTGGYLIGFVVAAFLIGSAIEAYPSITGNVRELFFLMLAGLGVIYLFGVIQLSLVLGAGMREAIALGAAPFIAGDILKATVATGIAAGYGHGIRIIRGSV